MTPAASPKRRYLALFFPLLSADRWRREHGADEKPLAFIEKQRGAMRIVAVSEQALALGIGPGLGLADARARVPELVAITHDPKADIALLETIADDCERYTPSVALYAPNGLILDITGCIDLWADENALADDALARLTKVGLNIRHAFAATPDRARSLARHGPVLPVSALDLEDDATIALKRVGLYTVDEIAKRPRVAMAARFGKAMVFKLARVLGEEDVRITPRRPAPLVFTMCRFPEPIVRTDYVLKTIASLIEEVREILRERNQGGRSFSIHLFRSDGDVRQLKIETGAPTRDAALLIRLFRERIEALSDPLDPGFGYDTIRLDVVHTEALTSTQIATDGQAAQIEDAGALIDRLGVRLGQKRVSRFAAGNSHIPELAGFTAPASGPRLESEWSEIELGNPPPRPLHLFAPPQRIEVKMAEVPDGPPCQFRWRKHMHVVRFAEGPERIGPEWWKRKGGYLPEKSGLTRDYFRVVDEHGHRFWLFRHGLYAEKNQPDWYLHGVFA